MQGYKCFGCNDVGCEYCKPEERDVSNSASVVVSMATCDQEVWVTQAIMTAMKMAIALYREKHVGAAEHLLDCGMEGVAEGATVEIINTLGMELEYVNIKKPLKLRKQSTGLIKGNKP